MSNTLEFREFPSFVLSLQIRSQSKAAMVKSVKKKKFYACGVGRKPGVYETWDDCKAQIVGFSRASFKSFASRAEAEAFVRKHAPQSDASTGDGIWGTGRPIADPAMRGAKRRRVEVDLTADDGGGEVARFAPVLPSPKLAVSMYFDGGARGNPGVAGAGAIVTAEDTVSRSTTTTKIREFCGIMCTNNVAEYSGLRTGLRSIVDCAREFFQRRDAEREKKCSGGGEVWTVEVSVKGDSNLIINQMLGAYECRSEKLRPIYKQCIGFVGELQKITCDGRPIKVTFEHVYRKDNKEADGKP